MEKSAKIDKFELGSHLVATFFFPVPPTQSQQSTEVVPEVKGHAADQLELGGVALGAHATPLGLALGEDRAQRGDTLTQGLWGVKE